MNQQCKQTLEISSGWKQYNLTNIETMQITSCVIRQKSWNDEFNC